MKRLKKRGRPEEERRVSHAGRKGLCLLLLTVLVLGAAAGLWAYEQRPRYIQYRDIQLEVLRDVPARSYDMEAFQTDTQGWIHYEKDGVAAIPGIDVSYYQQDIDWNAVAEAGMKFAMIRVGYRGYSQGNLRLDDRFEVNLQGALEAGLKVGVYFFSQAVTAEEAREEARFLLSAIAGREVSYPVVFDWEPILGQENVRTRQIEGAALTELAQAFCQEVEAAGYQGMVYFNQEQGYLQYDLSQLKEYGFWLAQYNSTPDFYYQVDLWQYSHTGTVPGIQGAVDLNLAFQPLDRQGES